MYFSVWYGVIFVRDGIYKDGIFRFNISLPEKFPEETTPPVIIQDVCKLYSTLILEKLLFQTIIFQNEIFHPSVSPFTGTLDISHAFPKWQPRQNHIWQLLKYIQFVFQYPNHNINSIANTKLPNKSAADLLSQNKAEYISKVKENVRISRDKIYDPQPTNDIHHIVFERFDNNIHGPVLERIRNKSDISISSQTSGVSWLKGEYKTNTNSK